MEAQRLDGRMSRPLRAFYYLYKVLSGYGEDVIRASLILALIWAASAIIYTRVGFTRPQPRATDSSVTEIDSQGAPLKLSDAFVHSFGVMIFQKPEPSPLTRAARIVVYLETVLGPIQAALFGLALRRQFMK
jgi:hypothetical protein